MLVKYFKICIQEVEIPIFCCTREMEYANQQETEAVNSKGLKHSSFLNEKSDCLAFL